MLINNNNNNSFNLYSAFQGTQGALHEHDQGFRDGVGETKQRREGRKTLNRQRRGQTTDKLRGKGHGEEVGFEG